MSEELIEIECSGEDVHVEAAKEWGSIIEETYKIREVGEYVHGAVLLESNKEMINAISGKLEGSKKKAYDTHKTICALEKEQLEPLFKAEEWIKTEMIRWRAEQEKMDIENDAFRSTVPELDNVEMRTTWTYEIENESLLPREFLSANTKLLGEHARKSKGSEPVTGVRFHPKTTLAVRSKK
jgi:hypothetical protein